MRYVNATQQWSFRNLYVYMWAAQTLLYLLYLQIRIARGLPFPNTYMWCKHYLIFSTYVNDWKLNRHLPLSFP